MLKLGDKLKIDDILIGEQVLAAVQDLIPLFTYFTNYLENDLIPKDMSFE